MLNILNGKYKNGKRKGGILQELRDQGFEIPYDVRVHGFRSSFRDWVAEKTSYSSEVAEMALGHAIQSKVEAAYRRGELLEKRRNLMIDWESYCLTGRWGKVVSIKNNVA